MPLLLLLQSAPTDAVSEAQLAYRVVSGFGAALVIAVVRLLWALRDDVAKLRVALLGIEGEGGLVRDLTDVKADLRTHKHETNDRFQEFELRVARCEDEDRRQGERRSAAERRQRDRRGPRGGEAS